MLFNRCQPSISTGSVHVVVESLVAGQRVRIVCVGDIVLSPIQEPRRGRPTQAFFGHVHQDIRPILNLATQMVGHHDVAM
jgi:hypothetical protein